MFSVAKQLGLAKKAAAVAFRMPPARGFTHGDWWSYNDYTNFMNTYSNNYPPCFTCRYFVPENPSTKMEKTGKCSIYFYTNTQINRVFYEEALDSNRNPRCKGVLFEFRTI
jgi:hypothetical protein